MGMIMRLSGLLMLICALTGASWAGEPLRVVTGIAPYAWLAGRIGGETIKVESLLPAGSDPHVYQPLPAQVAALARADLFIASSMPFESALHSRMKEHFKGVWLVMEEGVSLRMMEHACHGDHGHEGHSHLAADPHYWLDLGMVVLQAARIRDAVVELRPQAKDEVFASFAQLVREIEEVDAGIAQMLEGLRGRSLLVFHPAWGYFTDRYGMHQLAVEQEGKAPSAKQLADLLRSLDGPVLPLLLTQPQSGARGAARLAEHAGWELLVADPLIADFPGELLRLAGELVARADPVGD
jgi:zinc transport system substrate-binding protein